MCHSWLVARDWPPVQECTYGKSPASDAFLSNEREALLLNRENEYETELLLIEDRPRPTIKVFLQLLEAASHAEALLDSGSDVNILLYEKALVFRRFWKSLPEVGEVPWKIVTANGTRTVIEFCLDLEVKVGEKNLGTARFYVLNGVPVEAVIGNPLMIT